MLAVQGGSLSASHLDRCAALRDPHTPLTVNNVPIHLHASFPRRLLRLLRLGKVSVFSRKAEVELGDVTITFSPSSPSFLAAHHLSVPFLCAGLVA